MLRKVEKCGVNDEKCTIFLAQQCEMVRCCGEKLLNVSKCRILWWNILLLGPCDVIVNYI